MATTSLAPAWLTDKPIAHRGIHNQNTPENSKSSILAALEAGLPFELDLQMTFDNKLIVFHDRNTKRLTGKSLSVTRSTLKELKRLSLKNGEKILTLEEMLELVDSTVPMLIEVKPAKIRHQERSIEAHELLKDYTGPYAVQSFDKKIVKWFKRETQTPAGLILGEYHDGSLEPEKRFFKKPDSFKEINPDFVAHDICHLTPGISKAIREKMPLVVWTVDSEEKLKKARKLADNVIFEKIVVSD